MSGTEDYKSTRLRRNAELASAVSNVRKDLYDWKQAVGGTKQTTTNSRPASGRTTPSFPQPPPKLKSLNTNSLVKKTTSLKDLNVRAKKQSKELGTKNAADVINPDVDYDQIYLDRPVSSNKSEFLTAFGGIGGSKREDSDVTNERAYLSSRQSVRDAASRDPATLDQELVIKLNKKESLSVNEMDLSQFNLKSMKNLEKVLHLLLFKFYYIYWLF